MLHLITSLIFAIFIFETMQYSWWLLACEIMHEVMNPASSLLSTLYLVREGLIVVQCSYSLLHPLYIYMHIYTSWILILQFFSSSEHFSCRSRSTDQGWTNFCSANLIRLVFLQIIIEQTCIICKYFCLLGAFFACSLETLQSCPMDHPCTSPSVGGDG